MAMRGDARLNMLSVNAVLCIEASILNMASLKVSLPTMPWVGAVQDSS